MIILPTRIMRGKTLHVGSAQCISVSVDLWFGSHQDIPVSPEGIADAYVPDTIPAKVVNHWLVVLLGGKRLLLQMSETKSRPGFEPFPARVYLDEKVYHEPPGMVTPYGCDEERLEIGLFFQAMLPGKLNLDKLKYYLNGT